MQSGEAKPGVQAILMVSGCSERHLPAFSTWQTSSFCHTAFIRRRKIHPPFFTFRSNLIKNPCKFHLENASNIGFQSYRFEKYAAIHLQQDQSAFGVLQLFFRFPNVELR